MPCWRLLNQVQNFHGFQLDLRWFAQPVLNLSKTAQSKSKQHSGKCWVFQPDLHSLTHSRVTPPPLMLLPHDPRPFWELSSVRQRDFWAWYYCSTSCCSYIPKIWRIKNIVHIPWYYKELNSLLYFSSMSAISYQFNRLQIAHAAHLFKYMIYTHLLFITKLPQFFQFFFPVDLPVKVFFHGSY